VATLTPLGVVAESLVELGQLTKRAVHEVGLHVRGIIEERYVNLNGADCGIRQGAFAKRAGNGLAADHQRGAGPGCRAGGPQDVLQMIAPHGLCGANRAAERGQRPEPFLFGENSREGRILPEFQRTWRAGPQHLEKIIEQPVQQRFP